MMMIEGKSVMVVSRGVAAGLETALVLAGGHATQDGGEMDASPHITMVCKALDFKETSGASRGVRHVSPGQYSSNHDILAMLRKIASKDSVLILDNVLQQYMMQLRHDWGTTIFVSAYPTFSPGGEFSTVITTPSCNSFTLSSLHRTLRSTAGRSDDSDVVSESEHSIAAMTKGLKDGEVLAYKAEIADDTTVSRWTVSTEPLAGFTF